MKHSSVPTRVSIALPVLACLAGPIARADDAALTATVPAQRPLDDDGNIDRRVGLAVGRVDDSMLYGTTTTVAIEGAGRGIFSPGPVGGAVTSNGALGSTADGGLVYGLDVGLGLGARYGRAQLGATIGAGVSGITGGILPFAFQVPVIAYVGIPLGPLRVVGAVRGDWLFASDDRQDGAETVTAFDEVGAEAGLFLDRRDHSIGLLGWAREQQGTSLIGASLVYGHIATGRR
jgi:hypothetical protein